MVFFRCGPKLQKYREIYLPKRALVTPKDDGSMGRFISWTNLDQLEMSFILKPNRSYILDDVFVPVTFSVLCPLSTFRRGACCVAHTWRRTVCRSIPAAAVSVIVNNKFMSLTDIRSIQDCLRNTCRRRTLNSVHSRSHM